MYAKPGYQFYSVCTPSFFSEVVLPESEENMTDADKARYDSLAGDAERHGAHIHASYYRIG